MPKPKENTKSSTEGLPNHSEQKEKKIKKPQQLFAGKGPADTITIGGDLYFDEYKTLDPKNLDSLNISSLSSSKNNELKPGDYFSDDEESLTRTLSTSTSKNSERTLSTSAKKWPPKECASDAEVKETKTKLANLKEAKFNREIQQLIKHQLELTKNLQSEQITALKNAQTKQIEDLEATNPKKVKKFKKIHEKQMETLKNTYATPIKDLEAAYAKVTHTIDNHLSREEQEKKISKSDKTVEALRSVKYCFSELLGLLSPNKTKSPSEQYAELIKAHPAKKTIVAPPPTEEEAKEVIESFQQRKFGSR